jgi:hypothetical protein
MAAQVADASTQAHGPVRFLPGGNMVPVTGEKRLRPR